MMQQTNPHKRVQQQEPVDLLAIVRYRYLRYWPLFILAVIVALACAYVYLRYATPVYKISATLLVKDEAKDLGGEDNILSTLDLFGSKKNIENEIQILTSRTLIRDVIKRRQLYGEIYRNGNIRDVAIYREAPLSLEFLEPELIGPHPETVPLAYDSATGKVLLDGRPYALNDTVNTPWGNMVIKKKPGAAIEHDNYFVRITNERLLTQSLLKRLTVTPISKLATVIKLEYADVVPARGEDILNDLIHFYNKAAIEDKNRLAANTMAFVEERLRIVTGELSDVEKQVAQYKTSAGIVDISEQSKMFLSSVQENDTKINEANMQLSMLDAIEKYVSGKSASTNMVPATLGISDPVLLQLVTKLYETEMEKERLKKTTGANSPVLESLNRQAELLKPGILENIGSQRANLEAAKSRLTTANDRFAGILKSVPAKERTLLEVSRQQAIKNNIYTFLLQKREETALAYSAAISDSRIVDSAESASAPFSPRRMMVFGVAVLAGLVVVAGIITLKDMLNRQVSSRAEIEKATAAPVVAEIMLAPDKEPLVITEGRRSLVAEQFRTLRTSLSYIGLNGDNKTLLVTSSISGEGKSFVSLNLASSLSLLRKKVVLLEFDLRKPMLSKMLGINREPGITNYLVGKASLSDVIHPIDDNEYLFLMPSGVIPPNPTELILNGRLGEMLDKLRSIFDYLIIDTAPVGLVTDARLLAPMTDACLYVMRHQVTPRQYLGMIDNLYRSGEVGKINLVYNGVKPGSMDGYSYGHGYGYVEEMEKTGGSKQFLKNIFNP
ncbi:GumC family protein [Chitinophaga alhagiae]|uniref:GumC family protein n=1 Tax=Chitinophaga alhagiae TaxID=2203219 RepID=UPI000E5AD586|nr:polysaccharide biosynthesis tyrosine autokinase [Chitinophaga alhagiae]